MRTFLLFSLALTCCLCLLALPALSADAPPDGESMILDKVVAVVNSEVITWVELYQSLEFEMSAATAGMSEEDKRALYQQNAAAYLDVMIEQRLQLQEAKRLGITVNEEEVDAALANIRNKSGMDEEAFAEAVRQEGFSPERYRTFIREQIIIGRLVDREVRKQLDISSEEIRRELKRLGLKEGTYYRLSQLFFHLRPGESYENVSPKVEAALAALRASGDFAQVAREYSEGPAAQRGGDLGLIPADQISQEFLQALEGLSPGELSAPFTTSRGVHIVLFLGTQEAREVLLERGFEQQYREWLRRLREKSFVEVRL